MGAQIIKPNQMSTTKYPDNHVKDVDEQKAYFAAERRRMYKTSIYNRLKITECLRMFNSQVELKARQLSEQEDDLTQFERRKIYEAYMRRYRMSTGKLAMLVFPEVSPQAAKGYISQYNKGSRFSSFEPWVLFAIAATLKCKPCDLIEDIA